MGGQIVSTSVFVFGVKMRAKTVRVRLREIMRKSGGLSIDSNQDWNYPRISALQRGRMSALFDLYRLDPQGSAMWLGTVQSYTLAIFEIELTAARAPGDYTIVNRKTGRGAMA